MKLRQNFQQGDNLMEVGIFVRIKSKDLYGIVEDTKDDIYLIFCVKTPTELHECMIDDLDLVNKI